jgi:hypothetical protein
MRIIIDTSSLLSLVRYYLPFDKDSVLFNYIKTKILDGNIIIIDKVYEECFYVANGLVLKKMDFLKDNKIHYKTTNILPDIKFFNSLENEFCNPSKKRTLNPSEFENRKNEYLKLADSKILLLGLSLNKANPQERIIIVTEETETSNDNKAFKKIPAICRMLSLDCISLPELIKLYNEINIKFI